MKRDVTVRRPSRLSNVRVLVGVARSVATRVRRVEAWIAGQEVGSRRSRRSCYHTSVVAIVEREVEGNKRSCRALEQIANVKVGASAVYPVVGQE